MLEQVAANDRPCEIEPPAVNPLLQILARLGEGTVDALEEGAQVLSFFGHVIVALGRTLLRPGRLRFTSLVHHMEDVGLNALPIVGLISLLIGVVLAYQGASTLKQFGAEIFVVNLIGISILREIGILLTAVVVAGRSGSAFAAAIGSMVIREEVDAMRTLGLDPMEVLVLPRLLALVLTLPMLAFFADMMGLLGGAAMAWIVLDVSPAAFVSRLNDAIVLWTFWTGIIKAPFFGFLIGMIGCLEGMRVRGSAESVGRQTTRAVVTSLFLVIVVDALFSIFYSTVGI
jgi:phospholipid/cholesterol/gamma-HCH transport system permease protein